jgi:prepilin-type N-terminal cleavage/methylation domain-containing protein
MKTNVQNRRGFTLVELLVVIVIIASLAGLTAPMVIRQRKKADQTQATSNARQIGLAMTEFEADYGSYPDAATLTKITAIFPAPEVTGTTEGSNGYFKQLMHAGITQSEEMFYAKAAGTTKPDGDLDGVEALKEGEVGFAYIMDGATDGMTSAGNPARVLVATPMATIAGDFDGDPFDRKAVVLRIDNSVTSLNIAVPADAEGNSGPARIGADNLLDAGFWGNTTPTPVLQLGAGEEEPVDP